jgi:signal transduction histidine kinase
LPNADKLKPPFARFSLTQQFLGLTAMILVGGMLVIGYWVGRQIEASTVQRAVSIASIYVESILGAQKSDWSAVQLDNATHDSLDQLFLTGPLQRIVVRLKFWHPDGTIFYSNDHTQIGQRLKMGPTLEAAFRGQTAGHVSALGGEEHEHERELGARLLEVFVPVRAAGNDEVVAVAEFYYSMEDIDRDIRAAQWSSWWVVLLSTITMWALLHRLVYRANNTIVEQQRALVAQLTQRVFILAENERMQERLREAGARTTALNENFLQRTAAHLHDGPAQDIALALLRFESIAEPCAGCTRKSEKRDRDIETLRAALNSSLDELRAIASGLRIPPGMGHLSLVETVERAVRDFERKFEQKVNLEIALARTEGTTPMAVKITAYRMIQEALANCWWHARGSAQKVRLGLDGDQACIEVSDQGPGFDVKAANDSDRLGLALLSERVRLLGGRIEINSIPGMGAIIKAWLPLSLNEEEENV